MLALPDIRFSLTSHLVFYAEVLIKSKMTGEITNEEQLDYIFTKF